MLAGVTLLDPATTYIEPGVEIGPDTVILPNTHLPGQHIGAGCVHRAEYASWATPPSATAAVECSVLEGATLARMSASARSPICAPGARLERGVHMGNFGEVKNCTPRPGRQDGPLQLLGRRHRGRECEHRRRHDHVQLRRRQKHPTVIGDDAFIGSDTLLVAPVTVGAGARTGAGAVVTTTWPTTRS